MKPQRPVSSPHSVSLTPAEFRRLHQAYALMTVRVQTIQREAAQRIVAAQAPVQQLMVPLLKKYAAQGLRPDVPYAFDEAAHALVLVPPDARQ